MSAGAGIRHLPDPPDPDDLSSDSTIVGDLVFTTQIPVDDDGALAEGIAAQCELVLVNLREALARAGTGMASVAHLTIYLTDMADRAVFNEAYKRHFPQPYPVRAAIGVGALARPAMRVELTAVAARDRSA